MNILPRGWWGKKTTPKGCWAMFRKPQPLQRVEGSTAVHLQFVWQYAPHLYRCAFLVSKLRRQGNPAIRLPFVRQYAAASHLYGSTFGKILGVGVTGTSLSYPRFASQAAWHRMKTGRNGKMGRNWPKIENGHGPKRGKNGPKMVKK